MSILHKVISGVDDILDYFTEALRSNASDYCDVEAPINEYFFVAKDGSIGTVIELLGVTKMHTINSLDEEITTPMWERLKPSFDKKGHAIQVYFSVDPTNSKSLIENAMKNSRETTRKLELDFDDLYDSRIEVMQKYVNNEKTFLVLWTTPEILTKTEMQNEKKTAAKVEDRIFGISRHSMNPLKASNALAGKHQGFVNNVLATLDFIKMRFRLLDIYSAFKEMKKSIDPINTSDNWRPVVIGDKITPSIRRHMPEKKMFDSSYPNLGWQLMNQSSQEIDSTTVLIGECLYSSCFVDIMPNIQEGVVFDKLFVDMSYFDMPWRISFLIEGSGLSNFALKKLFAQILTLTNKANNKLIHQAVSYLQEVEENNIDVITQLRVNAATWCKANYISDGKTTTLDLNQIVKQRESLIKTLESWKETKVVSVSGDPFDSALSSAMGIKRGAVGTKLAAPLNPLMQILPLSRKTSPWDSGGVLYVTLDGKLIPYRPYSSLQTTYIGLIWSPPGGGKSVLLNYLNTGLCMEESNTDLPFIRTIDAGKSSFGFCSMIREALPENKRHLVLMERMRNTKDQCINIFDTNLGCRFPLPTEEEFISRFLQLLCADKNGDINRALAGLITKVIPEMYLYFSDRRQPKRYTVGFNDIVDNAVKRIGYQLTESTTYWQIVDALFLAKRYKEAKLAQVYAMPCLSDIATVVSNSPTIKSMYDIKKDAGNEMLINELLRSISEALNRFPILSDVTRLDFANARIVSLDLDEVAKGDDAALFYMLARYVLAKDFYVAEEEANSTPAPENVELDVSVPIQEYKDFHRKNFIKRREDKKRLNIDEFHLTRGNPYVVHQVIADMRLGRKYNVEIILASQDNKDFKEEMKDFATAIYIMQSMSRKEIDTIKDVFDLTEVEQSYISQIQGGGRSFFAKYKLKNQSSSFIMAAKLSAEEFWAYSTTQIDAAVRDAMYKMIGPKKTRSILAKIYPGGVQKLAESMVGGFSQSVKEDEMNSLADNIVNTIMKKAESLGLLRQ